jgi:transcriptional regulator with XRE-family HTH domain
MLKTDENESGVVQEKERARDSFRRPIGERLRARRERSGKGLRELARDAGVSPSLVSQIELGKSTPSVATLYSMVSALGISFDEVFLGRSHAGPGGPPDLVDGRVPSSYWQAPSEGPVLRASSRLTLTLATGVRWERLTAAYDPYVEFFHCVYPPGGESCPADELMTHPGFEYGILLEGQLGAAVGQASYELEPGDSIAFGSVKPHRIWTIGDEPALAIWTVVGRDDDPRVTA